MEILNPIYPPVGPYQRLHRKGARMPSVIEYLESFNRKERFFLIGDVLGNTEFKLAEPFRTRIGKKLGVEIPANAFVAMDYHLDWIHASVFLASRGVEGRSIYPNDKKIATGTQRDVDLIIGFEDVGITHLLFVEAKAETGWSNKQLRSKARRLCRIFGHEGREYDRVKPYFLLMSPRCPSQIDTSTWPSWTSKGGEPIWLKLPVKSGRRRITRTREDGKQSKEGKFFRVL